MLDLWLKGVLFLYVYMCVNNINMCVYKIGSEEGEDKSWTDGPHTKQKHNQKKKL
jgi:hypothetical protein